MIRKDRIFKIIVNLFFIVFTILFFKYYSHNITYISNYTFIVLILLNLSYFPLSNNSSLFIVFILIFEIAMFGRFILTYSFSYNPYYGFFNTFGIIEIDYLIKAAYYGMLSLLTLNLSYLIFYKKHTDNNYFLEDNVSLMEKKSIKITGLVLFFISFPAFFLETILKWNIAYSSFQNSTFYIILGNASNILFPSAILLLYSYRNKFLYYFFLSVFFIKIFLGARGIPILQVVTLLLFYNKLQPKKEDKKIRIMLLIILGYLVVTLFSIIKSIRLLPTTEWIKNINSLFIEHIFNSNPIFEVIYEFGIAIVPSATAIKFTGNLYPIQYGKTFFYSLTTAIPDLFKIRPERFTEFGNVGALFSNVMGSRFGSSMIQEFYFNFYKFTPLLFFLLGIILSKYFMKLEKSTLKVNVIFNYMFIFLLFWWPRSNMAFILRYTLINIVSSYIIHRLIYAFIRTNSKFKV